MTHRQPDNVNITRSYNTLNYSEWLSAIKQQQRAYYANQTEEMKHDDMSDYELFIAYIIFNTNIVGYSEISIIARIVRYFVGSVNGVSIFNETSFRFQGIRISIAIHPISAQIYIADEHSIYQFQEKYCANATQNNGKHKFKTIATISQEKKCKITDLTFSSDGRELLCLMNSNLDYVCYVIINDDTICIEDRILYYTSYDNMDYLRYDFNHFYFNASYLLSLLNFCDISNSANALNTMNTMNTLNTSLHINIRTYSTLYNIVSYKKELWIVCNSIANTYDENNLNIWSQPILVRIPFKFVEITRELQSLNNKMKYISHKAMDDVENDEYEGTLQVLQNKINELRVERIKNENRCEIIDLYVLLKLKEIHVKANINRRNEVQATVFITAFDVDKLHGGIYLITSDKKFFRIEQNKNKNNIKFKWNKNENDEDCWFSKVNAKYPNHFFHTTHKWNITHEALLHNVLPDGLPLGVCNVRYDSITGRIIVADNYKIQALYI